MNLSNSFGMLSDVVGMSTSTGLRSGRELLPSRRLPPPANARNFAPHPPRARALRAHLSLGAALLLPEDVPAVDRGRVAEHGLGLHVVERRREVGVQVAVQDANRVRGLELDDVDKATSDCCS